MFKTDKEDYDKFIQLKEEIVAFLNIQIKELPEHWDLYDHALVVLYVSVCGLTDGGASSSTIRSELEAFLKTMQNKNGKIDRSMN